MENENPRPKLEVIPNARFTLGGEVGRRLAAVTEQWILPVPYANPSMLEMFRGRDRQPYLDMVPWAGEFAGKYLTHAAQIYRLTRSPRLADHLHWFVDELAAVQDRDGYLGPWPKPWRLKKGAPNCQGGETWDAWGHYHLTIGLLLWHRETGSELALTIASRIGDLLCDRFLDRPHERLHDTGAHEMNQAPIHSLTVLYRLTGQSRYLGLAHQIEEEFEIPPAGDYLRQALAGKDFQECPKPRWESLHPIMGLAELHYATGESRYQEAFTHMWWSMLKGDRHNNGGFTSGEKATGDPYHTGPIETCCTIAWMAMTVEMLRLTSLSVAADELELSLFNSGLGMMSPSGRWVTYNTPMDGRREASAHTIVFQARPGSPELNCCSVNGPRALGLIGDWGLMSSAEGVVVNYYGPGRLSASLPSGNVITITQDTEYPRQPVIKLGLESRQPEAFSLSLRIPYWSAQSSVSINREPPRPVAAGQYLHLKRTWSKGDTVSLELDFRPHFWVQPTSEPDRNRVRMTSVYRGPILLAHDARFDEAGHASALVPIEAAGLGLQLAEASVWLKPWMLVEPSPTGSGPKRLCDFASAGAAGNAYFSWLPVRFDSPPECEFSTTNPLRSIRV